jgi:hypothetical protein
LIDAHLNERHNQLAQRQREDILACRFPYERVEELLALMLPA